jgi:hypothetical protein
MFNITNGEAKVVNAMLDKDCVEGEIVTSQPKKALEKLKEMLQLDTVKAHKNRITFYGKIKDDYDPEDFIGLLAEIKGFVEEFKVVAGVTIDDQYSSCDADYEVNVKKIKEGIVGYEATTTIEGLEEYEVLCDFNPIIWGVPEATVSRQEFKDLYHMVHLKTRVPEEDIVAVEVVDGKLYVRLKVE